MFTSLALSLLLATGDPPASRLAVIQQAADFALIDQDGKIVKLSDYAGKVVLVNFMFTTCNGSCPATTHRMTSVYQGWKNGRIRIMGDGYNGPPVVFLSITLDPQRDTSEILRLYAKLYDIETNPPFEPAVFASAPPPGGLRGWFRWSFLTGQPETVSKTIADWGMWAKPAPNGQLDHPSRIFLVDQQQRIREIYNVDLLRPDDVLDDIALLYKEGSEKK